MLKDYFPLALAPAVRAREPSVPLLQAILKEKTTCGQTSQGSPLFVNFCSNYYGTLEYKGHAHMHSDTESRNYFYCVPVIQYTKQMNLYGVLWANVAYYVSRSYGRSN